MANIKTENAFTDHEPCIGFEKLTLSGKIKSLNLEIL